MTYGIEIYNAKGVKTLDSNDRVAKSLGFIRAKGVDNSVVVEEEGEIYYQFYPSSTVEYVAISAIFLPKIIVNNNRISWSYDKSTSESLRIEGTIYYGVY